VGEGAKRVTIVIDIAYIAQAWGRDSMTDGNDALRWGPAEGEARQLVVLLHGLGADGADLIDLAPYWARALPHAAFLAPHAPTPYAEAGFGRQWFPLWDRSPAALATGVEQARLALDLVLDNELARLGVADYALMGFSQGAMTAIHTGLRRIQPPCAILAYSGRLLAEERLGEIVHRVPVLLVHGEDDAVVPAAASRQAADALREAGVPVEALFCPGLGHGLDDAGLAAGALALQRGFAEK
jgi:phospholipase/carboxylesterase